jgi:cell division protein FtsQ
VKSGDSLGPGVHVKNQGNNTSRPLIWEDEPPAENRFRRTDPIAPRTGRSLPGMPLEMQDPDGDDAPRKRFSKQTANWWRPESTAGRVFLALGVLAVVGIFATTVAVSRRYLERDSRFRIVGANHIQAAGLNEVTRADLLPVFGEDIGRNVFFVPINQRRKELEAIPWVEHATVMRLLPDQIRVQVVERKPVAFTRHGQQIGLVDANGVLLDMSAATMAAHHYSFPVVTGIDPGDPADSRKARMFLYGRLMAELDAGSQHYSEQISEIDLTDPEDARVLMPEQGADVLTHFGDSQFLERYQRYRAHIAEWRQQYPKLTGVDLRYDHQVVLEMASGATTSALAAMTSDGAAPQAPPLQAAPSVKPSAVKSSGAKTGTPKTASKTASGKAKAGTAKSSAANGKSKTVAAKTKAKSGANNTAKAKNAATKTASTKTNATKTTATAKTPAKPSAAKPGTAGTTATNTNRTADKKNTPVSSATANPAKKKPSPSVRQTMAEGQ